MKNDKERVAMLEFHKMGLTNSEMMIYRQSQKLEVVLGRPRNGHPLTTATTKALISLKVNCLIIINGQKCGQGAPHQ